MACGRGQRAVPAPAGHPGVHQAGIALQAAVRTEPEPLQHARAEALQQHVGAVDQGAHLPALAGVLEVGHDRGAPAQHVVHRAGQLGRRPAGPVHPDHVRAEVGQLHGGVRHRPEPGQLDHPQPGQRAGHPSSARAVRWTFPLGRVTVTVWSGASV